MGSPMKIRTKLEGDVVQVRVLDESSDGNRAAQDARGRASFRNTSSSWLTSATRIATVLSAQWGPAISRNPYMSFKFQGAAKGEKIKISWVDNKGDSRTDEATIE